jgi:hypothetical protein
LLDGPCFDSNSFIYLYPIISKHFYGYWLRQQKKLKELRDKIEDATLLTREESNAIRLEIINARDDYEKTINRQAGEIEALKENSKNIDQDGRRVDEVDFRKHLEEIVTRQSHETDALGLILSKVIGLLEMGLISIILDLQKMGVGLRCSKSLHSRLLYKYHGLKSFALTWVSAFNQ